MLKSDNMSTTSGDSACASMGIRRTLVNHLSFHFLLGIALFLAIGCKTAATDVAETKPFVPGLGACKTTITTDTGEGLVRYVRDDTLVRQMWDVDGDGNIEAEVRHQFDTQGRLTTIERADAQGNVVEKITRKYDGLNLVEELGDRWQTDGTPGPDGTPDWRRDLDWRDGVLVEERIDELDEEQLPGIDGEPEFVVRWELEDGKRVRGERAHGDLVVATYALAWEGGRLKAQAVDLGADGRVDEQTTYTWTGSRVTRVETTSPRGNTVLEHSYCQ